MNPFVYFFALLLFPIIATLPVQAQVPVIVGKVFHQHTDKRVSFSGVGILGSAQGTVANEHGEFELHLTQTPNLQRDTLVVSSIGYFNAKIALKDIPDLRSVQVHLEPRGYVLDAVPIIRARLSAEEIVRQAWLRIPQNYLTRPFLSEGFYREYFKENGAHVAFAEASVSVYDPTGYASTNRETQKNKEIIALNELRVSDICNQGNYVLYIDLNYALRTNPVRNADYWKHFISENKLKTTRLQVDSITYADNDTVYCISYQLDSHKHGSYEGRVFIRTKDFVVMRLEITARNALKTREENGAPRRSKAIMTFRSHQGKWYLNYINARHDVSYTNEQGQVFNLDFYSELIIEDLQTETDISLSPSQAMPEQSIFYQPRYRTYDPDFWADYHLFEDSESNDSIIADLERKRPLDQQYRANGKIKTIVGR